MALTESAQKLKRGDKAIDFSLQGIDGKTYSLTDFQGPPAGEAGKEGLLLIFMCNHCPYVKAKIEEIVQLHKEFDDRVGFIGINSNDPNYPGEGMDNMKAFAKERGVEFPYVLDDTQKIAKAYGATCTPDPFLFTLSEVEGFDKEFKLVFHGRINDAMQPDDPVSEHTMKMKIEQLLSDQEIADEFKPSMGCSIKWIS